jgi:hypothetical protein
MNEENIFISALNADAIDQVMNWYQMVEDEGIDKRNTPH